MSINKTTFFSVSSGNLNLTRDSIIINKEQYELLKCEFCDDHIKRRYIDMKEQFYKIFKNYIKLIKFIKNKDETNLKKSIDEIGVAQKELIQTKSFLEKFVNTRKKMKLKSIQSINVIVEGLDERERNTFFEELNTKKDLIKKFRRNIHELEIISNNIQEMLEAISLSNSILNNN